MSPSSRTDAFPACVRNARSGAKRKSIKHANRFALGRLRPFIGATRCQVATRKNSVVCEACKVTLMLTHKDNRVLAGTTEKFMRTGRMCSDTSPPIVADETAYLRLRM